jgi:glycosyltransferase 2 family protein
LNRKGLARAAVGIVISVVCLALLLRGQPLDQIGRSLAAGHPWVLLLALPLFFTGIFFRSLRWRVLLSQHPAPQGLLFRTIVIGLTVNDILPARLGEVARVFLLARDGHVPVGTTLASIVVERVLDGIALTAIMALGIFLAGATGLAWFAAVTAAVFAVATVGLFWAAFAPNQARAVGYGVIGIAPGQFRLRLRKLVDGVLDGLAPMGRADTAIPVLVLSLIAWVIESGMYLVLMYGWEVPGGLAAAFLGAGAANLATLIPAAPGYAGTFDLALQRVLTDVFFAPEANATAYTLVVHLVLVVPVVLLGLFFLWREDLSLGDLGRRPTPGGDGAIASEEREPVGGRRR